MEIIVANNQVSWDNWLKKAVFCPFQQFWGWGEVLESEGKRIERLIIKDGEEILAQAQITYVALPFGWWYAYCAGGPVFTYPVSRIPYPSIVNSLADYFKNKQYIFFRVEPPVAIRDKRYAIRKAIDLNPSTTTVLDLSKTAEELFGGMEKKTRYGIRQAQNKGVVVKQEKNFDIFWKLLQETGKRNSFNLHSKKHYEVILARSECAQLTAYKESTPVATALFWGAGDTFTYMFAALEYAFHDLQAPYLIQKEAIELAKSLGFKKYDFYGVAPSTMRHSEEFQLVGITSESHELVPTENNGIATLPAVARNDTYEYDHSHQYAGITKFKMGFGGRVVARPGTFDVVLKPFQYRLYGMLRTIRRLV